MFILVFFIVHWQLSVFFQSFFLHRYGAHKQFTMSKGWERFFYLGTYISQGSSFLSPRGYALLHRMHHAFADTSKDPHSPENYSNVVTMMLATKSRFDALTYGGEVPEPRFAAPTPEWPLIDKLGASWPMRILWGTGYTAVYFAFATHWWMFLLLPYHYVMGPVHGAIVNWCGHRYGYRNFKTPDVSRNMLAVDFLTMGELFQNNHHKFGQSPNFAARWFEIDPTYAVIRVLAACKVIDMTGSQVMRYKSPVSVPAPADALGGE